MARIDRCLNIADFRREAKRRLPAPLFHYIEGGADDEVTLSANTQAFGRYALASSAMRDVGSIDMRRTVLGCPLRWPLILAPTGMSRMFHPDGELAVVRQAARAGVGYALSTMATTSIEAVAQASDGPKIFQLYLLNDEGMNFEILDRCKAAGFDAICITVDTVVAGNRERDLRYGLSIPPRLDFKGFLQFARKPRWWSGYLASKRFGLPNVGSDDNRDLMTLAAYFAEKMESNITWTMIERLAHHWGGPLALKGIQSIPDARAAPSAGVSSIILSNHGGRQLDGAPPAIDLLGDMVDVVGDRLEIILDGGFRRGSHICRALAIGARACMTGRPYLYGLSAFGEAGVGRVLEILHAETERTLGLMGCNHVDELSRANISRADAWPEFLRGQEPLVPSAQLRTVQ